MLALFSSLTATAQSIKSLVMPGDVVVGHAEVESQCSSCHLAFNRSEQRNLCLDCHEDVASDVANNLGFHGLAQETTIEVCADCHTDHEGRNADILGLDEAEFDHSVTDFELLGHHPDALCDDCHAPGEKRRDAPGECIDCHLEDNAHDESMGPECSDCHNESDWVDVSFDHNLNDYPLLGKHAETACLDCHDVQSFQDAPDSCFGCHEDDDKHDGRSGNLCENCHSPESWTDSSFDHARDTDFPLEGRHGELSCNDCHSDDPFMDEMQTACASCHLEDDNHDGHNGSDCAACHSNDSWLDHLFDHARDTKFTLNGSHADVACVDCHIEPVFETAPGTNCSSCHLDDDAHEETQGEQCDMCHDEALWEEAPFFEHDLTLFPLLGEHGNIECDSCHETRTFVDASGDCVDCHLEDDEHDGVFADNCDSCHNPVAWDLWWFDHNTQSGFLLEGAHIDVVCNDCHRTSLGSMQKTGGSCGSCHRPDDIHDGEFGPGCGRCHSDRSFEEVRSLQ